MNNWLALEVHCPHHECWNSHLVPIEAHQLTNGTDTIETTCPHCNEALTVVYELRVAVKHVRPREHQYPQAWPLPGRAGW